MSSKEMKLVINRDQHSVVFNSKEYHLPQKEFNLLWLLCIVPGKVYSRDEIFSKIWLPGSSSSSRTVDVHIVNIRRKLGKHTIRTIKGVGFKIDLKNVELISSSST